MNVAPLLRRQAATRPSIALKRAGRLFMAFAVLAQLFGVVSGPLEHWQNSTRLGPHFEDAGSTKGHYTHDEAKCVACAILHVVASPAKRSAELPAYVVRFPRVQARVVVSPVVALRTQSAPRAPPAVAGIG